MSAKSRFAKPPARKTMDVVIPGEAEPVKVDVQPFTFRGHKKLTEASGGADVDGKPKDPMKFTCELLALACFEHGTEEKIFATADEVMDADPELVKLLAEQVSKAVSPNMDDTRKNSVAIT